MFSRSFGFVIPVLSLCSHPILSAPTHHYVTLFACTLRRVGAICCHQNTMLAQAASGLHRSNYGAGVVASSADTVCNSTVAEGCFFIERVALAVLSAVASIVLAIVIVRKNMRRLRKGRCACCTVQWPRLHHYPLFTLSIVDFLVSLNFLAVRPAFVHGQTHVSLCEGPLTHDAITTMLAQPRIAVRSVTEVASCVCMCACMHVGVGAWVRACVRACLCVRPVFVWVRRCAVGQSVETNFLLNYLDVLKWKEHGYPALGYVLTPYVQIQYAHRSSACLVGWLVGWLVGCPVARSLVTCNVVMSHSFSVRMCVHTDV